MKKEWVKPEMKVITDTKIILECLYEVYQMDGIAIAADQRIEKTMVYPFVKMLENQYSNISAEEIHQKLWEFYMKGFIKEHFLQEAYSFLQKTEASI